MTEPTITDPVHGHGWNTADRWGGWSWHEPRRGEHFRRCSFCGSIHPEDLAAETGWRAEWADRKYGFPHKFYVDIPNRNPDALFYMGSSSGGDRSKPPAIGLAGLEWVAWEDLTPEQVAILHRDGVGRPGGEWHPDYVQLGPRKVHHAKFYSVHLADPTITEEVKDIIAYRSGLVFTFTADGKVAWRSYKYDTGTQPVGR